MLSLRPSTGMPRPYGYVFLLAYLALFVSLVFLISGGWRSYEQYLGNTKWPATEAQVIGCSVDFTYGYSGRIYGRKFQARCSLHYAVNGVPYDAKKFAGSIVFVSDKQIELTKPKITVAMQRDWARLHPRGSFLTIRYDPADPQQISLAGADAALQKNTPAEQLPIGQGLFLFGIVVLLAGMFFRKRAEAS